MNIPCFKENSLSQQKLFLNYIKYLFNLLPIRNGTLFILPIHINKAKMDLKKKLEQNYNFAEKI